MAYRAKLPVEGIDTQDRRVDQVRGGKLATLYQRRLRVRIQLSERQGVGQDHLRHYKGSIA